MFEVKFVFKKSSRDCLIYWLIKYSALNSWNIGRSFLSVLRDSNLNLQLSSARVQKQKKLESWIKLPLVLLAFVWIFGHFRIGLRNSFCFRIFCQKGISFWISKFSAKFADLHLTLQWLIFSFCEDRFFWEISQVFIAETVKVFTIYLLNLWCLV